MKNNIKMTRNEKTPASAKSRAIAMFMAFTLVFATLTYLNVQAAMPKISRSRVTIVRTLRTTVAINNTGKDVKWSISNGKVAAIKKKGKNKVIVIGKKGGKAVLTGKIGKKAYKCQVIVKNTGLSKTKLTIKAGKYARIKFIGNVKPKWSVSNKKIAKITGSSAKYVKIRGLKAGTVAVKAVAGGKVYKCKVIVKSAGKSGTSKSGTGNTEKHKGLKSFKEGQKFDAKNAASAKLPYYIKDIEFILEPRNGKSVEELKKDYEEIIRPQFNIPASAVPYNAIRYTIVNNSDVWVGNPYCSLVNTTTYQIQGYGIYEMSHAEKIVTNGEVYVTYSDLEFPKEHVKPGTSKTFTQDAVLGEGPIKDPRCTVKSTSCYGILKDNACFCGEIYASSPVKNTSDKTPYIYFKFTLKDMKGTYKIEAIKGN